jgi:hypothetical protein
VLRINALRGGVGRGDRNPRTPRNPGKNRDFARNKIAESAGYGERAGHHNANFLDPALFRLNFLKRLEPHGAKVGPLILEFGTFAKSVFQAADDFLYRLDDFLGGLPGGWRYAVEIRNAD